MKYSVIIPCHNVAPWIEAALQSVADQTYPPHEVIVIDDGSTDDTVKRVRRLGLTTKLLASNRRNGAGTRNVGIAKATCDWIAFLDADDIWYPNHLERATLLLANSGDVGFLNWNDRIFNDSPDVRVSRPNGMDIAEPTTGLSDERFFENFFRTRWFNMPGCVVNRKRLVEIGMFDETQIRRHDIDMWVRLVKDHTWSYDPVPSNAYRVDRPGSISGDVSDASYFALRSIQKNLDVFPVWMRTPMIQERAASAIVNALANGKQPQIERAYREAFHLLSDKNKLHLWLAKMCPPAFRVILKCRRKLHRLGRSSVQT